MATTAFAVSRLAGCGEDEQMLRPERPWLTACMAKPTRPVESCRVAGTSVRARRPQHRKVPRIGALGAPGARSVRERAATLYVGPLVFAIRTRKGPDRTARETA